MNFPDQIHFFRLQEELWKLPKSKASLMVGAGFSLNADPLPGVSSRFSTWNQLARSMFDELNPRESVGDKNKEAEREKAFLSSNALRLASEYEAAFDVGKLESLIKKENPDLLHNPSVLHLEMMRLPWQDVFTTNYDTLLERTEITERSYNCVTTANELTEANQPRIIKLHGSFPSVTPFIITEEDFRKYPQSNAAFVNTVQQSLIENSLVLIGFSGDDPNFLAWTGWIRDHLDKHHAPIYLVGVLDIGNAERQLLKSRGVTAIDLYPIFKDTDQNTRHHTALEWFFKSLHFAEPSSLGDWPTPVEQANEPVSNIPLCCKQKTNSQPNKPKPTPFKPLSNEDIISLIEYWKTERSKYPNWLICPQSKRAKIWVETRDWINPLVKALQTNHVNDVILALRELTWRMDTAMAPLYDRITPILRKSIDEYFDTVKEADYPISIFADSKNISSSKDVIQSCWLQLAYADMQEARETYNSSRWHKTEDMVSKLIGSSLIQYDQFTYEKILWSVWNSDLSTALQLLDSWVPSDLDTHFTIAKAGLLGELGQVLQAINILRPTLIEIRSALNKNGHSIQLLSLEGWCLYILSQMEFSNDTKKYLEVRNKYLVRYNELAQYQCDPTSTVAELENELAKAPPSRTPKLKSKHTFDGRHKQVNRNIINDSFTPLIPAYSYIRLFEKAGIPMRLPHVNIAGESLVASCKWIESTIGYWSPAIILRTGNVKLLESLEMLSRFGVTLLPNNAAENIYEFALNCSERELHSQYNYINIEDVREPILLAMIEIQSRLALRISDDNLDDGFNLALQFYDSKHIQASSKLFNATQDWIERLLDTAKEKTRLKWIESIVKLQIPVEMDTENTNVLQPLRLIPKFSSKTTKNIKKNHPTIFNIIQTLIETAANPIAQNRAVIFDKLLVLNWLNLLTKKQIKLLSEIIWNGYELDGFPLDESKYYFANYLHTPVPSDLDIVSRVKTKILSLEPSYITSPSEGNSYSITLDDQSGIYFREIIRSSAPIFPSSKSTGKCIDWSIDDSRTIFSHMVKWWDNDKKVLRTSIETDFTSSHASVRSNLKRLDEVLAHVIIPRIPASDEEYWKNIFSLISEIETFGFHIVKCLPAVLINKPEEFEKIQNLVLRSFDQNAQATNSGAKAICFWYELAYCDQIKKPKLNLIGELVDIVSFRRLKSIDTCTKQLAHLIARYPKYLSKKQFTTLNKSLVDWHRILYITKFDKNPRLEFEIEDIPTLRETIAFLAGALASCNKKKYSINPEPDGISLWRKSCKKDHLPEVKRAFRKWGKE